MLADPRAPRRSPWGAWITVLVVGCGRIGFDPTGTNASDASASGDGGATMDARVTITGASCMTPTEITVGGSYAGDTCLASNTYDVLCGQTNTPEVFVAIVHNDGANWSLSITNGFEYGRIMTLSTCTVGPVPCDGSASLISSGAGFRTTIAIEKVGGGCGPFVFNALH
jgi:hypothetical protein